MRGMRAEPMHKREEMAAVWPHSIRYGREVGTTMLIFIMAMAYSATSPIILPFALVYFIFTWCAPARPALPCPAHSALTLRSNFKASTAQTLAIPSASAVRRWSCLAEVFLPQQQDISS